MGTEAGDKPEIDFQRLEHLEEIRQREHAASMQFFETYRERLAERADAHSKLAEIERQIAETPHSRGKDAEWQDRLKRAQSKLAETERRVTEATRARDEGSERFQAAGALHTRCLEWCKENKIEVSA